MIDIIVKPIEDAVECVSKQEDYIPLSPEERRTLELRIKDLDNEIRKLEADIKGNPDKEVKTVECEYRQEDPTSLSEDEIFDKESQIEDLDHKIRGLKENYKDDIGKIIAKEKPFSEEDIKATNKYFNVLTMKLKQSTDFLLKYGIRVNTYTLVDSPKPSILSKESLLDVISNVRSDNWKDSCCGTNYLVEDLCNETAVGILNLLNGYILPMYRIGDVVWFINEHLSPISFSINSITIRLNEVSYTGSYNKKEEWRSNEFFYTGSYIEKREWQLFESKESALNSIRGD